MPLPPNSSHDLNSPSPPITLGAVTTTGLELDVVENELGPVFAAAGLIVPIGEFVNRSSLLSENAQTLPPVPPPPPPPVLTYQAVPSKVDAPAGAVNVTFWSGSGFPFFNWTAVSVASTFQKMNAYVCPAASSS